MSVQGMAHHLPSMCGAEALIRTVHAHRTEQSVDLCRTDLQQLFPKNFHQRRGAPLIMFEPFRQRRLRQLSAKLIARQQHCPEQRQHCCRIIDDFCPRVWGG